VRTVDDVARFWSWPDEQTVAPLEEWTVETLVLDAVQPLVALRDRVAQAVELDAR
jgi:hypothetical protein